MTALPAGLAERLAACRHLAVLSGAGISAESGVPTFRDAGTGLWANYRPEDLATPEAFASDPALVWRWYQWRRELVASVRPNAGHLAVAALARQLPRVTVITQNVDGLHQAAGSEHVIEFHGNINRNKCFKNNHQIDSKELGDGEPPACPRCGALLRPDVVWFGEAIPPAALNAALAAVKDADLLLVVGTSAQVQPAAGLADLGREHGALLVEINPQATPLTPRADYSLRGPAGEWLPRLAAVVSKDL